MATLLEQFTALNEADLSALRKRIDALRAQAEADLKRAGATDREATQADIAKAADSAGLSIDDFMTALERAKKTGLI
jgi:hypothetical protein